MMLTQSTFTPFFRVLLTLVFGVIASLAAMPSRAQWAVVDAPAIVQLIQQVQAMEEQVQTARNQLTQAKQALTTMTGDRGMEWLLGGVSRNYLPSSWTQLSTLDVRSAIGVNAVLTPPQVAALSAADQSHLVAVRRSGALQQTLAQSALANASGRFASIQALIAAIATATDQKAILDLQARISAELGMLQNEQTKLQVLHQATQAQEVVLRQQEREQIIAGHGRFLSRFQPVP
jgi:type IV secretion system protein VirB5